MVAMRHSFLNPVLPAASSGRRLELVAAAGEGTTDGVPKCDHVRHGTLIFSQQAALDFLVLLNPCDALAFDLEVGTVMRRVL